MRRFALSTLFLLALCTAVVADPYPNDYVFARTLRADGRYDVENPDRVNGFGEQIHLATEIQAEFPGEVFRLTCSGTVITISFQDPLTDGEQTVLAGVVSDHRTNAP